MTTPRTRALVSLAATTATALALVGCVRAPSRAGPDGPAPIDWDGQSRPLTIRFDNNSREQVHVYLIGDQREWLLGRVEPGAVAMMRIPPTSLSEGSGFARLAVIPGVHLTPQAARDIRATFTMAQPASAILAQRWRFAQGQLTSLWIGRGERRW